MKLHKLQLNKMLQEVADISVKSSDTNIIFNYDNKHIHLSFDYSLMYGFIDFITVFVGEEPILLNNNQINLIVDAILLKTQEIKELRKEDSDLINEVGF